MPQLFPPEIIKSSSENYFSEQSKSSQVIYLSAILLLILAFALLPSMSVQVTTQSQGVIRSASEDNPIIPVVSGVVTSCRISENQTVSQGDTLILISADHIIEDLRLLNFRFREDSLQLVDLNKLIKYEYGALQTSFCKQEYTTFSLRIAEQKTQLSQAEREFSLTEKLYIKGITPKHDFEKIASQLNYEKNKLASIESQQFSLWQQKLKDIYVSQAEIATRIQQFKKEKDQYCLTAPLSGTITGFTGIKAGNFIAPNQQIARIAPDNDLMVECFVSPSDIGLIEPGQQVSYQLHAFNYNLWGMATGIVNEISNNVVNVNNQPYFRIRCRLDQRFLKLKNGYTGDLKKGMTLTGRFKVADRTLYQLLYDKADNWLNPKRKNG